MITKDNMTGRERQELSLDASVRDGTEKLSKGKLFSFLWLGRLRMLAKRLAFGV